MLAYRINDFNAPPVLEEIESPPPGANEVKVRIRACGLNFADLLLQKGTYQDTPPPPVHPWAGTGG